MQSPNWKIDIGYLEGMNNWSTWKFKATLLLRESYEKESRVRLAWTGKYSEQFQCTVLQREPTNYRHGDIRYELCARGMDATTRDHVAAARHRLKAPVPDYQLIKPCSSQTQEPVMVPIDNKIKELINDSRDKYFKERYKVHPEDKYNFPETTNWRYGWKLNDSMIKPQPPAFPRINVVTSSLFSNVGFQPDPDYYVSPDQLHKSIFCS